MLTWIHRTARRSADRLRTGWGDLAGDERGDIPGWVLVTLMSAVIVVAICIVAFARHRSKAKAEEQRRQQEILSTPLEKFGDGEVEDLAAKYAAMDGTAEEDSPVDTADLETFGDQDLKDLERKYGGKGADGGAARKQD